MQNSEIASGISRNRQERKELYRLMENVKSGLIKRIYVKCRDRFARNIDFEIEIEVRKCGVELIEVLQEVIKMGTKNIMIYMRLATHDQITDREKQREKERTINEGNTIMEELKNERNVYFSYKKKFLNV